MPYTDLQNQLAQLLEASASYQSLDAMARGEMKQKLLGLPEKEMQQAVQVFLEEQKKMFAAQNEIVDASSKVKQQEKSLHSLMLRTQSDAELEASSRSSEDILKQLPKDLRKKNKLIVPLLLLGLSVAILVAFLYFSKLI